MTGMKRSAQRRERPAVRAGSGSAALDPDVLLADALKRAGRAAFKYQSFIEPFRRLLAAYVQEADLSTFGLYATRFDLMRCLDNLLLFDAAEERNPKILQRRIDRPIVITGVPRSGTTFLHTLLAQDPALSVPRCWQLVYPYARGARAALRRSQVEIQLRLFAFFSHDLATLHPLSADEPQECTDITAQVFQSLRFDNTHHVPSYRAWLKKHGHLDAYRFHRRFLQHLDGRFRGRRRWVLKAPDHVFALDALKAVYPDAQLIFLHRDPLRVVASAAKLTECLQRPFTRHVDRQGIGQLVSTSLAESANRMVDAAAGSDRILHLHYRQVVESPTATVGAIYRHCGLTLSEQAEHGMMMWLVRSRQRPHRTRQYSLAEFGLDAGDLRRRFLRYMEAFAVASEWAS